MRCVLYSLRLALLVFHVVCVAGCQVGVHQRVCWPPAQNGPRHPWRLLARQRHRPVHPGDGQLCRRRVRQDVQLAVQAESGAHRQGRATGGVRYEHTLDLGAGRKQLPEGWRTQRTVPERGRQCGTFDCGAPRFQTVIVSWVVHTL